MDLRARQNLRCDVLIVGGGATGVAAAVTAARQGCRVVLIERYGFCGGGAVAGLSGTVCGLYDATDSRSAPPKQVVFGFADEFVAALEARGGISAPLRYGKTFTRVHDPLIWRETADDLLSAAGVRVIYHALAIGVLREGDRLEGAEIWTKQGVLDVRAALTVDASGDADLAAMARVPTFVGDGGHVQNPTMMFRIGGVDVGAFKAAYGDDTIMGPNVSAAIVAAQDSGRYQLPRAKIWLFPTTRPDELLCNCTRIVGADGRELNTLFHEDFTEAETQGRLQVREYERFFRDTLVGCQDIYVNDTGVQVGVRQSRQVQGRAQLMNADVIAARKFADGIAKSPWPIELHTGVKPRVEWILDDHYEVPFGCFVPRGVDDLIVAGRCLSAEHDAVASARVTAQCFAYGHAVGHAATIVCRERILVGAIDGRDVRRRLNADGARLD